MLGYAKEETEARFGFLLDALDAGAPPHGGFAFGFDRFAMLLAGCASLRDVIAFPKTQRGQDLLMDAPSPVEAKQLDELALKRRAAARRKLPQGSASAPAHRMPISPPHDDSWHPHRDSTPTGRLDVPDDPIIPFIEGDGTGPDIWAASVRVFDAAVDKAYGGKRSIAWHEVYAGREGLRPDARVAARGHARRLPRPPGRHQGPADDAGRRRHPQPQRALRQSSTSTPVSARCAGIEGVPSP